MVAKGRRDDGVREERTEAIRLVFVWGRAVGTLIGLPPERVVVPVVLMEDRPRRPDRGVESVRRTTMVPRASRNTAGAVVVMMGALLLLLLRS